MTRPFLSTTSREIPIVPDRAALLFIDVQNFSCHRDGAEWTTMDPAERDEKMEPFLRQMREDVLPRMQAIQSAARDAGIEVMYTTIESLTKDGRDRSLDYKITGFNVPKGSWDGRVVDEIAPGDDEIVLAKSSSSVFVSTHIDYVLRNLGVQQLIVSGVLTDQCVESAIRDACDLGYLVTQVTDACATFTEARQNASLRAIAGYCRQVNTEELLSELGAA
ncbi:isochorismatase family cysteine hydrolase [Jannaschia seohaensis]|uniref:Ureidoacrylate peracid hydrolase n=1 Tax=Jannaschia seohaensis TaxID=475081 RepID=A0A2Y9B9W1_9RHOB|nr:isochorismatase family cysteine hydrolase [Jannaschia seohaensis]PWJ10057.1 ureidoacrylate peracid hydrolase [Jannaschia seohaensis]SSA51817.1 ureidoacrylate peracid hydrolase [Jannaschia seohaensis]